MHSYSIRIFFVCLILQCSCVTNAQYNVRIVVNSVALKSNDVMYVAGSFNDWNPSDINTKLKPFGGSRFVVVLNNIKPGAFEFKITRGRWDKVETTAKGENIDNRSYTINNDTSIEVTVAGWKDAFPDKPKPNTASVNVHLLESNFYIPQLNRHRRIWIYLPASYQKEKNKSYPVLYMQDGQNLFNEQTAFDKEWGVDECLDTLEPRLHKECIVIGIDNDSAKRINEYNPYDNDKYGKGEGSQYVDFIANTFKPYIDAHYRTLKDVNHTYIAGSSMGGLISLYALIERPDVFGAAGIFSPALWIAPQVDTAMLNARFPQKMRIYFYAGEKESVHMISDLQKLFTIISQKNCCDVQRIVFPLGQHTEKYWRDDFDNFYRWLMQ